MLKKDGLVDTYPAESHNGSPRKYYRITDAGRAEFQESVKEWTNSTKLCDDYLPKEANLMRESEFLDLLRYYFRNAKPSEVKEILADYEAHFEEGKKEGLTEEEISKELGSPKDIYDSYQSEGVVDEKTKTSTLMDGAEKAANAAGSSS